MVKKQLPDADKTDVLEDFVGRAQAAQRAVNAILGSQWTEADTETCAAWTIRGKDCVIWLEERPTYCDRGNWIAKLQARGHLAKDVDGADGWPRYYFDLTRAKLEIEAWLAKRGQTF